MLFEQIALDVKAGLEYLRSYPGITHVLLLGHSGGGPTMTFYQAVSENGLAFSQAPYKLHKSGDDLANLPPADGLVLLDSDSGHDVYRLRSMLPLRPGCQNPKDVDPSLDPFDVRNGYNPNGPSTYSEDFKTRYFRAQSERMTALIAEAQEELRLIQAGDWVCPDNDSFLIPRGDAANLWYLDPSNAHTTTKPHQLLKNDGTIVTQIVENVRQPQPTYAGPQLNASFNSGTVVLSLTSFISTQAIRSTSSYESIEWCSSNNSTNCSLMNITVPLMIATMGAWIYMCDNEIHYENAKSKDKDFIVIEGALHDFQPCVPCESFPGQYSNCETNLFDYTAKWINARF